jgi:uncharacterized membrane protein YesL
MESINMDKEKFKPLLKEYRKEIIKAYFKGLFYTFALIPVTLTVIALFELQGTDGAQFLSLLTGFAGFFIFMKPAMEEVSKKYQEKMKELIQSQINDKNN